MRVIETHNSPDRSLRLIVVQEDDGDVSIGFDGYTWHTHGDILASIAGVPQELAIREFINSIIDDEKIIVVSRVDDVIREVWPTEDPRAELKYKPPEESLEFRRWSGRKENCDAGNTA